MLSILAVVLVLFVVWAAFTTIAALILWAFGIKGMVLLKMASAIGGGVTAGSVVASAVANKINEKKGIQQ